MAKAYVEIDGLELDIDEYESYVINTGPVDSNVSIESLREMNEKFGFPDENGAQL